jgi:hypothetical protein
MDAWPWLRRTRIFIGLCSGAACLLSCEPHRAGARPVLRADHPRGPGSFCALNPEGCPAPPTTAEESRPFDLDSCLKACEVGGAVLKSFCRGLEESWQRRLCWSVVHGSKVACKGMCYRVHACMDEAAECPEREE